MLSFFDHRKCILPCEAEKDKEKKDRKEGITGDKKDKKEKKRSTIS